jgi:hypothetical protein
MTVFIAPEREADECLGDRALLPRDPVRCDAAPLDRRRSARSAGLDNAARMTKALAVSVLGFAHERRFKKRSSPTAGALHVTDG